VKLVLLTSDGCAPCDGAKRALDRFIRSGEVTVLDIHKDPEAITIARKGEVDRTPTLLLVSKSGEVFAHIDWEDR
jgi:glutaredoxin